MRPVLLLSCCCLSVALSAQPLKLTSPSGINEVTFDIREGRAVYAVSHRGHEVIRPSTLGLGLEGAARLDSNFRLANSNHTEHRGSWKPVYGERLEFPDNYNALTVDVQETIAPRRTLTLEFRAADEGIAFRYHLPASTTIGDEVTEFRLPPGVMAWDTPVAQAVYKRIPVTELSRPAERPLLLEVPGGIWAAIAEAAVENYPSMFLSQIRSEKHSLIAKLMGPARTIASVSVSPWRVVLLGSKPGELLEHNYLLQNLSPPSRVKDTSWIKPGKVLREVTLSTRGGREAVDFAMQNGLQYIEYDAGWYGLEYDEVSDATRVSIDPKRLSPETAYQGLDLPEVIRYGRSKGIGVILYVNRRALERQLDVLLPLFEKWGVAGVKYGFVNVHTQPWTKWLYDAVAKAADHHLMVDIHDEFRPTGMSRTYPNLLTQEGILGNEGMPDANHSTTLPFTRMLAGAADYTYCWLDPRLKNTWGHQLALSVALYSPWQFVYWYDRPVAFTEHSVGMDWFRELPTVWDDTRVLDGTPGEYAVIARRKGTTWYVGVVGNNNARELGVTLDMLAPGREYEASVYADGSGAKNIVKSTRTVRGGERLVFSLQARGGVAVVLRAR